MVAEEEQMATKSANVSSAKLRMWGRPESGTLKISVGYY